MSAEFTPASVDASNVDPADWASTVNAAIAEDPAATQYALLPSSPKPFHRIAYVGDSITDGGGSKSTWYASWMTIPRVLSSGKLAPVINPATGCPWFAASGCGTLEIKKYFLDTVMTSEAEAVVIFAGTNDYTQSRTAAQVATTLAEMADALIAVGKTPIICEILPLPSGQSAKAAWIIGVNSAISAMVASRPQVVFVDWLHALDSNSDGTADSDGYFSDSVHPDLDAMWLLGDYFYSKVSAYVSGPDYFDGLFPVSPNPTMSGTLGVGNVATGWAVDDGSGKTVVKTLIARGGSLGNWQQLAISGNAANNTVFRYGFGYASGASGSNAWVAGDEVEMYFEFETDNDLSATPFPGPTLQSSIAGQTFANRAIGFGGYGGTFTAYGRMASGVIVSPRYIIPPNTDTLWPFVNILGTGTWRIGRMGIRRAKFGTAQLTGIASLDFSNIVSGSESTLTVTVTGAVTAGTPCVYLGWASALPDGIAVKQAWVSASNTVSIRVRNNSGADIDPTAVLCRAIVVPGI